MSIRKNKAGFTIVELIVSLMIMAIVFGFFLSLIRSSPFFGNFEDRRGWSATKKISSDLNSIFLQYGINSGSVLTDMVPTKTFDRIGLVYSGGTVIIGVIDKNTSVIFDPNSNDNGFLGIRALSGSIDFTAYTGTLDPIDPNLNIVNLRAYAGSGLLRMEVSYDTDVTNGNRENYTSGSLLYEKNYNY